MLTSLAAYALFLALAVAVPGVAVQRLARTRPDAALVLPLGTAACAAAYALGQASGATWLFTLYVVAALVAAWSAPAAPPAEEPGLRAPRLWRLVLPPFAACVALLAVTQYGWNRLDPESGDFRLDPLLTFDTTFHAGVTRELTLGWPPQVPGLAGLPLGYHLGLDLVRAAALQWARIDPFDSISRFDVTINALALMLALCAAAQRAGLPRAAVALAPWTLLLADFSYVFAANPQAHWWCDLLRGNLLLSLVLANPAVPALALALGALVSLSRALEGGATARGAHGGHLVLAALQAVAVPHFKVFLGAHLIAGLAAWSLLRRPARRPVALVAAACALSTGTLAWGRGGESVGVFLAPLDLVRGTRATLGLDPLDGSALAAWSVLWLLASLGPRVLGLAPALRALRSGPGAAVALGAMALLGWPLGLLVRVSAPDVLRGEQVINDAAYFVEQSGPLLWLFTVAALAGFARTRARRILAGLTLVSALPATLHFAAKKTALAADPFPAARLRAAQVAAALTAPGEVVLQRPGGRYPAGPAVFVSRRVAYERFTPYLTQFAARDELERRHARVAAFFRTRDAREALDIARSLGARAVCLYDGERLRFPTRGWLELAHTEPGATVYLIRAGGDGP